MSAEWRDGDNRENQSRPLIKRPVVYLALAWMGGMIVGSAGAAPVWGFAWAAVVCGGAHGAIVWMARRNGGAWRIGAGGILLWGAVFLLGAARQRQLADEERLSQAMIQAALADGVVSFTGRMGSSVSARDQSATFDVTDCLLRAAKDGAVYRLPLAIRVTCRGPALWAVTKANPAPGHWVSIRDAQWNPPGQVNPGVFQYDDYLRDHGAVGLAVCYSDRQLMIAPPTDAGGWTRFQGWVAGYRTAVTGLIRVSMSEEQAKLVEAILFGRAWRIPEKQRDAFLRSGTMHLFAVSGLHTGLMAFFVFLGFRLARIRPKWAYVGACLCLVIYVILTDFRPSAIRAAIMYGCVSAPFFLKYKVDPLAALAFAAIVSLAIWPRALWQAGFQLSYLCMLGLLTLAPPLMDLLTFQAPGRKGVGETPSWWARRGRVWLSQLVLRPAMVCLAVQLVLLPFLTLYFQRVSFIAPLTAILTAFPVMVAIGASALLSTVGFLGPDVAGGLGWLAGQSAALTKWVSVGLAWAPGASVATAGMPYYMIGAYYVWLFSASWLRPVRTPVEAFRGRAELLIRLAGVAVFWAVLGWIGVGDGSLRIVFLDVGQGDACFTQFPDGKTMLVDGGGGGRQWDQGTRTVVPALTAMGVRKLDLLVATHPDADHVGGLPAVMQVWPPALTLHSGDDDKDTAVAERFETAMTVFAFRNKAVRAGDRFDGDGYAAEVLWPTDAAVAAPESNAASVALRIVYDQFAMLLAGDMEADAEGELIRAKAPLEATLLKVSHHGSSGVATSAFLQAVDPEVSVISVGIDNRYGHPAPSVVERLEKAGVMIFRTDRHGAIEFKTDGRRLWARVATATKGGG